ncbi:zinc ribbon domain protein [bacterium BMS3Abin01]|nr:zinc ribbon domain protein [bacterium BMS3Abin01]HDY69335.1 zinc ribbon domain-containing protein [Actinomycetota bacterium]
MAIYDLKCDECEHQFEKYVSGFLSEDDKICPECGSHKISQKFTSFFGSCSTGGGSGGCAPPAAGGFG